MIWGYINCFSWVWLLVIFWKVLLSTSQATNWSIRIWALGKLTGTLFSLFKTLKYVTHPFFIPHICRGCLEPRGVCWLFGKQLLHEQLNTLLFVIVIIYSHFIFCSNILGSQRAIFFILVLFFFFWLPLPVETY